jgi:uncharacterized protein YdeI (YjbR/CyaY-like superfamily)
MLEPTSIPILLFADQDAFEAWLAQNGNTSRGIWLQLVKKGADVASTLTYAGAVEAALLYGWIDGQRKAFDAATWLQRFTPRGKASIWSKINRDKAEELIRAGRMQAAGLAEVERAKADGRWEQAYDSARTMEVPADLHAALETHPQAKAFFEQLDRTNRYAILFRLQTAKKAETRAKRLEQFVTMLEEGKKIYP